MAFYLKSKHPIVTPKKVAFLFVLLMLAVSCSNKKESKIGTQVTYPPSIILIVTDDQGWGDLSSSGNPNLNTPNIDALAYNGISFDNFFVQPVCSPTRAELLTGREAAKLGVYSTSEGGERFDLEATTIAEIFKGAGYETAAYGKWHNGTQPPYHPNSRGFNDYYGFTSGHWGNYFNSDLDHNGNIVKGNGFLTDDLTDRALEFIEKNKDQPFFLFIPYNTPHSPMQVPDEYWNRFKNKILDSIYAGHEKEDLNFTRAALAMVENIDENIGRISQKLKQLSLEENTIVVYLSDNGPNDWRWNGKLKGKKGSTDEGGVKTPFYVQWKNKLPAGRKIQNIASSIDVLPTLAKMAGLIYLGKTSLDGMDLSPLLFNQKVFWKDRVIYSHWNGKTSVRSQKYRLDYENQLFDMEQDMGQQVNVAARYPKIADSLKQLRENWLAQLPDFSKISKPFTLGHPKYSSTQLPARDGLGHGNIERSNYYPNDAFFTNWISENDSISWDVDVLHEGDFEVLMYYTLAKENSGVTVQLSQGKSELRAKIIQSHDPPLRGMEDDRYLRMESYVKTLNPYLWALLIYKRDENP